MNQTPIKSILFLCSVVLFSCTLITPSTIQKNNATPTATSSGISLNTSSKISIQVSWEGHYTLPNGTITAVYGPDSITIPLTQNGNNYAGNTSTIWHTAASGECTATGTVPITFDVSAKESTNNILSFTVNRTLTWTWDTKCPGISGGSSSQEQSYSYVFDLANQDGAKKDFNLGGPTWTFTLVLGK